MSRGRQLDLLAMHSRKMNSFSEAADSIPEMERLLAQRVEAWKADKERVVEQYAQLDALGKSALHADRERVSEFKVIVAKSRHRLAEERVLLLEIESEVKALQTGSDSIAYLLCSIPILNKYHILDAEEIALVRAQPIDKEEKKDTRTAMRLAMLKAQKRELVRDYTKIYFPEILAAHDKRIRAVNTSIIEDVCADCGSGDIIEAANSYHVCTECGVVAHTGYSTRDPLANVNWEDSPQQKRQYTYKRLNHFREYLRQIQGDSRTVIPEQLYDDLRLQFFKYHVKTEDITGESVRLMLRRLKVKAKCTEPLSLIDPTKYYEHREAIAARMNPTYKLLVIAPLHQERLCLMFVQLEDPFETIKATMNQDERRKNFLSYPFTYFKLNELNGWDSYNERCDLLKSVELMNYQDKWWTMIMNILGWQVVGRTVDIHRRRK